VVDAERAVSGLRELARLTSDDRGAERVAWTGSVGGASHTQAEDTTVEDVELGVRPLYELTRRQCAWAGARPGGDS